MKTSSRRDTLSIIADLLDNMREPKRVTHLLYTSNLSYSQLIKYLKMITQMELSKKQKTPFHSYQITQEGINFVNMVRKRQQIIKPIALD